MVGLPWTGRLVPGEPTSTISGTKTEKPQAGVGGVGNQSRLQVRKPVEKCTFFSSSSDLFFLLRWRCTFCRSRGRTNCAQSSEFVHHCFFVSVTRVRYATTCWEKKTLPRWVRVVPRKRGGETSRWLFDGRYKRASLLALILFPWLHDRDLTYLATAICFSPSEFPCSGIIEYTSHSSFISSGACTVLRDQLGCVVKGFHRRRK